MAKPISTLVQRRFGERREYVLFEDRLVVSEWSPFAASEYALALDSVPDESLRIAASSKRLFAAAVAASLGLFVCLLWTIVVRGGESLVLPLVATAVALVAAGGAWWGFTLSRRSWLVLSDGDAGLYFFADRPSREALDAFLEAVSEQKARLVREDRASRQQEGSMVDDLERLTWLRDQGYLTDEEYGALKRRLVEPPGGVVVSGPVN